MSQCNYTKSDGSKCQAQAVVDGDGFCFVHSENPAIIERRKKSQAEGGKNGRKHKDPPIEIETNLSSMKNVVNILSFVVGSVLKNEISPRKANTIGYLLNVSVRAIEKKDIEARLEHLESLLSVRK